MKKFFSFLVIAGMNIYASINASDILNDQANEFLVSKNCCNQGPPGPIGPTGATGATGPIGPTGATGATGPAAVLDYAYFFTVTAQAAIPGGGTVDMTVIDPDQSGGFSLVGGGAQVPTAGVYLITYQGAVSATSVGLGISINGGLALPGSVTGSFAANSFVDGTILERLSAGDIVTVVNAMTATAVTTVVSAGTYQSAPIVASLNLLRVAD